MIKNRDPKLNELTAYKKYWNTFGIVTTIKDNLDKDSKERLVTWKRFIKRIVAYLLTTTRYKPYDEDLIKIIQ